jgi:hypothetical protein
LFFRQAQFYIKNFIACSNIEFFIMRFNMHLCRIFRTCIDVLGRIQNIYIIKIGDQFCEVIQSRRICFQMHKTIGL